MNIERYLQRIGITEEVNASLSDLKKMQKQHLLNIPFENYDIHSNRKIVLDTEKIYDKVVNRNRGGFCYELNGLFYELLKEIGFEVKRIAARVYHEEKYGMEYDHLAIIALIDSNEYLVDVGFGEFIFHPLNINLGVELEDERGIFLFDNYENDYLRINKYIDGKLIPKYIFTKEEKRYEEYAEMCAYHQTSKDSHFTKKKFVTIPLEDGRITLTEKQLKIRLGDSISERELKDDELNDALTQFFNFK